MSKFRNMVFEGIILDKDGFEITFQQAVARIRRLRKARVKDPELFELNGGSLDLLLLYQHVEKLKTNPLTGGTVKENFILRFKN